MAKDIVEKVSYASPVLPEVERVVEYDENGNEYVSWVPVDSQKIIKSHGKITDWQLDNLLKAGVNPKFNIHTSSEVSRLEGASLVEGFAADADTVLSENNND